MNVGIGTEAAQCLSREYINWIFGTVCYVPGHLDRSAPDQLGALLLWRLLVDGTREEVPAPLTPQHPLIMLRMRTLRSHRIGVQRKDDNKKSLRPLKRLSHEMDLLLGIEDGAIFIIFLCVLMIAYCKKCISHG
jgi:hypothetical protein